MATWVQQKKVKPFKFFCQLCQKKFLNSWIFCFFPGDASDYRSLNTPGPFAKVQHPDLRLHGVQQAPGSHRLHHRPVHGRTLRQMRLQLSQSRPTSVSLVCFRLFRMRRKKAASTPGLIFSSKHLSRTRREK